MRIESSAFSFSSLESIVIPLNVCFIDSSAFCDVKLLHCLIESGNRRFVYENGFLIDVVDHKLIRSFSTSSHLEIARDIEVLGSSCFSWCQSLRSISFESNSRLKRIESQAFRFSPLCRVIFSTILFVAHDAHQDLSQLTLSNPDFSPAFDRWRRLRLSGVAVDFQRILRAASGLPRLEESPLIWRYLTKDPRLVGVTAVRLGFTGAGWTGRLRSLNPSLSRR
jgi:hypothetical protein